MDDDTALAVAIAAWHLSSQTMVQYAKADWPAALRLIETTIEVVEKHGAKSGRPKAHAMAAAMLNSFFLEISGRLPPEPWKSRDGDG